MSSPMACSGDEFSSQLKYHQMVSGLSSLSVSAAPFISAQSQPPAYPPVPPPSPMTPITPTDGDGERARSSHSCSRTHSARTQFDYEFALETMEKRRGANPDDQTSDAAKPQSESDTQSTLGEDDAASADSSATSVSARDEHESDEMAPPAADAAPALEHDSLLILLDWDDTLYPTSFMNEILVQRDSNSLALVRDDQIECLSQLGALTLNFLRALIAKYGARNIHIVTNSLEGWIRESLCYAACIAPVYREIAALLDAYRITRVSARSAWAHTDASLTPTQWKERCYGDIVASERTKDEYAHILTVGDQWTDHYAARHVVAALKTYSATPIHHAVKLKMSPSAHDLVSEMMYLEACFAQIFDVFTWTKSQYFAHPHAVQPVIIDYEVEERKQLQMLYQRQCNSLGNMNVNMNMNMNVNVNLNVIGK